MEESDTDMEISYTVMLIDPLIARILVGQILFGSFNLMNGRWLAANIAGAAHASDNIYPEFPQLHNGPY